MSLFSINQPFLIFSSIFQDNQVFTIKWYWFDLNYVVAINYPTHTLFKECSLRIILQWNLFVSTTLFVSTLLSVSTTLSISTTLSVSTVLSVSTALSLSLFWTSPYLEQIFWSWASIPFYISNFARLFKKRHFFQFLATFPLSWTNFLVPLR